jgi:hypothetical protein
MSRQKPGSVVEVSKPFEDLKLVVEPHTGHIEALGLRNRLGDNCLDHLLDQRMRTQGHDS